jgi:hypothetical protein
MGFDEHRGADVVAAADISNELVQQIPLIGNASGAEIPEVVMRIANRKIRLQDRLLCQCQPVIASEWHGQSSCLLDAALRRGAPRRVR